MYIKLQRQNEENFFTYLFEFADNDNCEFCIREEARLDLFATFERRVRFGSLDNEEPHRGSTEEADEFNEVVFPYASF